MDKCLALTVEARQVSAHDGSYVRTISNLEIKIRTIELVLKKTHSYINGFSANSI